MRTPVYSSRPDLRRAQLVDQGIALIESHGRAVATAFLDSGKVPFSVIVRIMSEPAWRRRAGRRG